MRPSKRLQQFGERIAIPFIAEPVLLPPLMGKLSDKTPAERARLRASRKRQRLARRKGRT
jgi:hypothetical protein